MKIKKPRFKEIRLRFLSVSVAVTLLLLLILGALSYLHLENIIHLSDNLNRVINSVTLVIGTLFTASLLLRLTIKRVYNLFDEPEERIFYSKIYSWSLYSIGVFVILYHFGVSLGNITIFIGLLTTGLAFAVRDVLLSFFGWIILLRKQPFRIGDYIKIGDDEGKVLHIGTFYVLLDRTHELPDVYTRVPNRLFLEKSISKLGKNILQEQILFQLSQMPGESHGITGILRDGISAIAGNSDHLTVYPDIKNEKLYLVVKYMVSPERRQEVRSDVIGLVLGSCGDIIVLPKI
ncbi:MAG: hypothetical protein EA408_06780 [Marinilabiliales bacterium]|nr:MAG: hypothetical protein EA408_06780 [Marinilabiliales bacterium]